MSTASPPASSVEELGCAALLAGLPGMGPRRLTALVQQLGPVEAWALASSGEAVGLAAVLGGDRPLDAVAASWARAGQGAEPGAAAAQHEAAGVTVALRGQPAYPSLLAADQEPPEVLFLRGSADALDHPRVSVVGCGLDVVYPARHRDLWEAVGERGLLLSEAPLGARPAAWRFPARNRIIAALADIVVVVESHATGGSLLTVEEALHRDRPVMVVPGSVRSPATAGTHQLLAEGCHPVRDASDVLVALGLTVGERASRHDRRTPPGEVGRAVLEAFAWEPATLEHLVVRTGSPIPELAVALERLLTDGWVVGEGGWYERVAAS